MSNLVTVKRTEFRSWVAGQLETTFGYRMYDNYGKSYNNMFDSPDAADSDNKVPDDDMELLKHIVSEVNEEDAIESMIYSMQDDEDGIEIDGTFYEYAQIEDIISNTGLSSPVVSFQLGKKV